MVGGGVVCVWGGVRRIDGSAWAREERVRRSTQRELAMHAEHAERAPIRHSRPPTHLLRPPAHPPPPPSHTRAASEAGARFLVTRLDVGLDTKAVQVRALGTLCVHRVCGGVGNGTARARARACGRRGVACRPPKHTPHPHPCRRPGTRCRRATPPSPCSLSPPATTRRSPLQACPKSSPPSSPQGSGSSARSSRWAARAVASPPTRRCARVCGGRLRGG